MNKHHKAFFEYADSAAKCSSCPRAKVGCVLVNPVSNAVISIGYNGPPRGSEVLCGGDCCLRDKQNIESGTHVEVGCSHAESNSISNAARQGTSTSGAYAFVNCAPCLACAKLLYQSGIVAVYVQSGHYSGIDGMLFLVDHNVNVDINDIKLFNIADL